MGGHWYEKHPLIFESITNITIPSDTTAQGSSLHGLVIRGEKDVGLYIGLHTKYVMILGLELIWTTE